MAKGQSGFRLAGMAALVGTVLILASPTVCIAGSAPADGAEAQAQAQAPDGARRQSRAVLPLAGALAEMILGAATGLGVVYMLFSAPLIGARQDIGMDSG